MGGTGGQGINGKASRIAEQVQHLAAGGIFRHQGAVFTLIQKEAGFLAFGPIYQETIAVLQHLALAIPESIGPIKIPVHQVQPRLEGRRSGTLVVNGQQDISEHLFKGVSNLFLAAEHAHGMGLQDRYARIPVDNEAGKVISFAVYQAEAVGLSGAEQPGRPAYLQGSRKHHLPEIRSQDIRIETEHPDSDGPDLIMATGQEAAVCRINAHQVAFGRLAHNLGHGAGKHPGVETAQRFFPALPQNYFRHFPLSFFCNSIYISRQIQASVAA